MTPAAINTSTAPVPANEREGKHRRRTKRLTALGFTEDTLRDLGPRGTPALAAWVRRDWPALALYHAIWVAIAIMFSALGLGVFAPKAVTDISTPWGLWIFSGLLYVFSWAGVVVATRWFRQPDRMVGLAVRSLIKEVTEPARPPIEHRRNLARLARRLRTRADRAGIGSSTPQLLSIKTTAESAGPWDTIPIDARTLIVDHVKGDVLDLARLGQAPGESWRRVFRESVLDRQVTRLGTIVGVLTAIATAIGAVVKLRG